MESYRFELLCDLPILDFDDRFDGIFKDALDEWSGGPSLSDVKVAASHILDDVKTIEQSLNDLSCDLGSSGLFTPPPTPESPCMSLEDTKVYNGLPMSPSTSNASLDWTPIGETWSAEQNFNSGAYTNNGALSVAVSTTTPITDFSFNANLLGTWVFVPSDSAPKVDMPCMTAPVFAQTQTHTPTSDVNLESRATFQVTVGEEGYYSWDQVNPLTTSLDSPETLSPFMGAESPEVESSFVLCRSEQMK
jgi:hypothetical protein